MGRQEGPEGAPSPLRVIRSVRAQQDSEGRVGEKGRKGKERGRERVREAEQTLMATDEVTGGARKATKSKLFEFLVHGVVSRES